MKKLFLLLLAVASMAVAAHGQGVITQQQIIQWRQGKPAGNPPPTYVYMYFDPTTGNLTCVNSSGSMTACSTLPSTPTANLCLLSTGTGTGSVWGSCSGATSSNWSSIVPGGGTITAGTYTIGSGSTLNTSGTGTIAASSATTAVNVSGIVATANGGTGTNLGSASAGTYPKANGTGAYIASTLAAAGTGSCSSQAITVLNGDAAPTCSTITSSYVNNSIAVTGVDINTASQVTVTHLASPLPSAQGGTANGFFTVAGPSTSVKTFTFPNASANVLTDNAAVTIAQGGTGQSSASAAFNALSPLNTEGQLLYYHSSANTGLAVGANNQCLTSNGTDPVWGSCSTGSVTVAGSPAAGQISVYSGATQITGYSTATIDTSGNATFNSITTTGSSTGNLIALAASTTTPTLPSSTFSLIAPNSSSITAYGWQVPTITNSSAGIMHVGANSSNISQLTVSQISLTGDVTGTLPVANGGTGQISLTSYNVLLGNSTGAVNLAAPVSGGVLASTSASANPAFSATPTLGDSSANQGTLTLGSGSSGGAITISPLTASGSYNFNLPATAGTSGQCLTSGGGGSNAMLWTSCGSTLNSVLSPTGNTVWTTANYTTKFSSQLTSPGASVLTITESAASSATSNPYLLNLNTLSGSTVNPFVATAQGTSSGVSVNTSGVLSAIGSGHVNADWVNGANVLGTNGNLVAFGASSVLVGTTVVAANVLTSTSAALGAGELVTSSGATRTLSFSYGPTLGVQNSQTGSLSLTGGATTPASISLANSGSTGNTITLNAAQTISTSYTLEFPGAAPSGSNTFLSCSAATTSVCSWVGSGSVASVSNSDGTLTISPTTGAIIASLNLAHANTWTATQTFPAASITNSELANSTFGVVGDGTVISSTPVTASLGSNVTLALATATANTVLAGPSTFGASAAAPTNRKLVPHDIPASLLSCAILVNAICTGSVDSNGNPNFLGTAGNTTLPINGGSTSLIMYIGGVYQVLNTNVTISVPTTAGQYWILALQDTTNDTMVAADFVASPYPPTYALTAPTCQTSPQGTALSSTNPQFWYNLASNVSELCTSNGGSFSASPAIAIGVVDVTSTPSIDAAVAEPLRLDPFRRRALFGSGIGGYVAAVSTSQTIGGATAFSVGAGGSGYTNGAQTVTVLPCGVQIIVNVTSNSFHTINGLANGLQTGNSCVTGNGYATTGGGGTGGTINITQVGRSRLMEPLNLTVLSGGVLTAAGGVDPTGTGSIVSYRAFGFSLISQNPVMILGTGEITMNGVGSVTAGGTGAGGSGAIQGGFGGVGGGGAGGATTGGQGGCGNKNLTYAQCTDNAAGGAANTAGGNGSYGFGTLYPSILDVPAMPQYCIAFAGSGAAGGPGGGNGTGNLGGNGGAGGFPVCIRAPAIYMASGAVIDCGGSAGGAASGSGNSGGGGGGGGGFCDLGGVYLNLQGTVQSLGGAGGAGTGTGATGGSGESGTVSEWVVVP